MSRYSIVIPAHNEEAVIGRCLAAFVPYLDADEAEVLVVPNGCTDRTAIIAAEFPGVRVLELAEGDKRAALNAADAQAVAFPRVYLDADIVLSVDTLRALAAALPDAVPRVAAPAVRFAVAGRPWLVRAFYQAYDELPYVREGLTGLGVFALSRAGRARFTEFPEVTADDLFVQRLFAPDERLVLQDRSFSVEVPRTLRALIHVRTRTAFGSAQLAHTGGEEFAPSTAATVRALLRMAQRAPRFLPAIGVYVLVTVVARLRAKGRQRGKWHRDTTTR